ncbi:hypothetical protein SAMN04244560_00329 [Thermoanaerobacter thermohydrosulfuricus]|uniref:Uncharacterized protein n=1 Tax=Thermoanaerobacter thermohydrosulfuricus TaxID=1516 RepID=A0A1G7ITV9_THETY|nr:hypothetical protein [Thermoanaerobacter thermohydrosulfuricus]SDF15984.1 hypothetical protein SAMN04244560_00329 [Thermoanaerobacter thermohydrosulfuricus]
MKPSRVIILGIVIISAAAFAVNNPLPTLYIILGLVGIIAVFMIIGFFFEYIRAIGLGIFLSYLVMFAVVIFDMALSPDKRNMIPILESGTSNLLIKFFPHLPAIHLIADNFWWLYMVSMIFPTTYYIYKYYKQLEREGRYF